MTANSSEEGSDHKYSSSELKMLRSWLELS